MNKIEQIIMAQAPCRFGEFVKDQGQSVLERHSIKLLQVNIGKLCNMACQHCHVEAGPTKTKEQMTRATVDRLLELLDKEPQIHTVDITGGAPELNGNFRYFVSEIRKRDIEVIDRCNLTVLYEEGQEGTAQFLADNGVQIVASLPCYIGDNVDKQRGHGAFDKSLLALQQLNKLGYGQPNSDLKLHLVFNPQGTNLPPAQKALELDYKQHLLDEFEVVFNQLFAITNMPIKRFASMLRRLGKDEEYMQVLIDNFNASALENVMCRELVSISWDGLIYDCDFNQMLELPLPGQGGLSVFNIDSLSQLTGPIATAAHCFGCTAGAGSSCGGALT